jgi:hypothetical protein
MSGYRHSQSIPHARQLKQIDNLVVDTVVEANGNIFLYLRWELVLYSLITIPVLGINQTAASLLQIAVLFLLLETLMGRK